MPAAFDRSPGGGGDDDDGRRRPADAADDSDPPAQPPSRRKPIVADVALTINGSAQHETDAENDVTAPRRPGKGRQGSGGSARGGQYVHVKGGADSSGSSKSLFAQERGKSASSSKGEANNAAEVKVTGTMLLWLWLSVAMLLLLSR